MVVYAAADEGREVRVVTGRDPLEVALDFEFRSPGRQSEGWGAQCIGYAGEQIFDGVSAARREHVATLLFGVRDVTHV